MSDAIYGILAFDISDDKSRNKIWKDLRKKVIRSTNSVMLFDFAFKDEIEKTIRKYASGSDWIFPAQDFNPHNAKQTQKWVMMAMQRLKDDVISGMRKTIDKAEKLLDEDKLKAEDVADRADKSADRARRKLEDAMIALATFRLTEEFDELEKAVQDSHEAQKHALAVRLCKIKLENQKKEQKVSA